MDCDVTAYDNGPGGGEDDVINYDDDSTLVMTQVKKNLKQLQSCL